MTYKEARVYLDTMSKYGSVLGLDTIRELLQELGNPQEALKFIHIAGTNGKGSVLAYTSTILSEAGYRIGRYVSPTVVSYLERIQIDGEYISEEAFARLMEKLQQAIARIEAAGHTPPTVFEIETAIAFLYFKEQQCDLVVLECGMGGLLDATNIIPAPVCAAFTSISIDHLGTLGDSLKEIAMNKAGIIKSGCHVVTGPQKPEVLDILAQRAKSFHCPIHIADTADVRILKEDAAGQVLCYKEYQNLSCPLIGRHQIANVITALEIIMALNQLHYHIPKTAIRTGLAKTQWPGRFTVLGEDPLFVIDGAHNEDAAIRLRESLELYFPEQKWIYIMGVFKDKDYQNIAKHLAPLAAEIHTISLPNVQRTLPADTLAAVLKEICAKETAIYPEASIEASVRNAYAQGQRLHLPILAFGSLSYLGELMEHYKHLTKTQEGDLL